LKDDIKIAERNNGITEGIIDEKVYNEKIRINEVNKEIKKIKEEVNVNAGGLDALDDKFEDILSNQIMNITTQQNNLREKLQAALKEITAV